MALFGSFGGALSNLLGSVGQVYGASSGAGILASFGSSLLAPPAATQVGQGFMPGFSGGPMTQLAMRPPAVPRLPAPMPMPVPGAGPILGALRAIVEALRQQGARITVDRLVSFIRRFGPGAATVFLSSYVGEELARHGVFEALTKKRRRINAGNSKALRRAIRRVRSFHTLCRHADIIGRGSSRRRRTTGRCPTCRKNPCSC